MRRLLILALATTMLVVAPAGAAREPSLTILRNGPLVVRGVAFLPRETVTVTSPVGHLRVRTNARGIFVASFAAGTDRCSGGLIVAVGRNGERVLLRLPRAMCAPASTP